MKRKYEQKPGMTGETAGETAGEPAGETAGDAAPQPDAPAKPE
jgi:hypothetical protein